MKYDRRDDQRGMSRAGLLFGIVIIIGLGALGWWIFTRDDASETSTNSTTSRATQQAIDRAKCSYTDTDLCKFFAAHKTHTAYTVTTTTEANGQKTSTILKKQGKDNYYLRTEAGTASEVISIGDTRYTKTSDGTWQRQIVPLNEATAYAADADVHLTEPAGANDAKVSYKKIGTEACGSRTCLKYQATTLTDAQTATLLWFDQDNYQLRRIESKGPSGSKQIIYSLASVNIAVPSPLKDQGGQTAGALANTGDTAALPKTGDD